MTITRASLLVRVKDPRNTQAWSEFHDLYAPLLYRYARLKGLTHEDAEDVRSRCYESIVRHMADFKYDQQKGSFKSWLRTLVANRVIDHFRKRQERIADSHRLRELTSREPAVDEVWEDQWRLHHLKYCLNLVRQRVSPQTYEIFQMLTEQGASVTQVCTQLKLSTNQVYKAKSRVLSMVREEMEHLDSA